MEWISVKDRLPPLTEPFMGYDDDNVRRVWWENDHAFVLAYDPSERFGIVKAKIERGGRWSEISSCSISGLLKPTHWMPLPDPPTTTI